MRSSPAPRASLSDVIDRTSLRRSHTKDLCTELGLSRQLTASAAWPQGSRRRDTPRALLRCHFRGPRARGVGHTIHSTESWQVLVVGHGQAPDRRQCRLRAQDR